MNSEAMVPAPGMLNALVFPRDRWQGPPPEVPEATDPQVGSKVLQFAEGIVRLARLGVAPELFQKAIAESPLRADLERAIGAALLKEPATLSGLAVRKQQGVKVAGGPISDQVQITVAGVPLMVRALDLTIRGNADHSARVEAFVEPPDDLIFHVKHIDGLDNVARAWGHVLVPLMEKEPRPYGALWARLFTKERRGLVELVLGPASMFMRRSASDTAPSPFESAPKITTPVAAVTVRIEANQVSEGGISWAILGPDAKSLDDPHRWEMLRGAFTLENVEFVAGVMGYKLRKVAG